MAEDSYNGTAAPPEGANSSLADNSSRLSANLTDMFHSVCPEVDSIDLQEALSHCEHKKCRSSSTPACLTSLVAELSASGKIDTVVGLNCGADAGRVGYSVYEVMKCLIRLLPDIERELTGRKICPI